MSLALYRKYRPATFAEVKGQEHVTEPLQQALRNGRINHAYLFSGPRGCGKTTSARILARSLNCEKGPTPEPCGVCDSCVALGPNGAGSIDVIEIDAASHGGVDDARDLREKAFFAPAGSRFKIYIIDEAHMVTREGFNALLKLVEEPPPHLKFVFATTEPEKVIGTIRSRTHHYPFRLIPPGTLRELLEEILSTENVAYEPAALPLVVRAGAGSARDSLSILDQLLAGADEAGITYARSVSLLGYTDASLLDDVVDAFADGDGAAVFRAVDRVIEGGHDPRRFAADLLERLRDLVVLAAVPDAGESGLLDAPPDQLEAMQSQAGRMGQAELTRAAEVFSVGLTEMRGATAPRLLLELMCARVLLPGASDDVAALLTRLERVERRLSYSGGADAAAVPQAAPRPVEPAPSPAAEGARPAAASAGGAAAGPAGGGAPQAHAGGGAAAGGAAQAHAGGGAAAGSAAQAHAGTAGGGSQASAGEARAASQAAAGAAGDGSQASGGAAGAVSQVAAGAQGAEPPAVGGAQGVGSPASGGARGAGSPAAAAGAGSPAAAGADGVSDRAAGAEPSGAAEAAGGGAASERASEAAAPAAGGALQGRTDGAADWAGGAASGGEAAASGEPGALDVAAVRRAWGDVLEAVKRRRRVAWMILINDVQVQSLDANILTLGFARDGDMKGFTTSGSDAVVQDALKEVLGVSWRVMAALGGGGQGAPPASAPPQAPPSPPASSSDGWPATQHAGPPAAQSPGSQGASPSPPRASSQSPPRNAAASGPAGNSGPPMPEEPPEPDEPDPDNDADAGPDAAPIGERLSGLALIQRELGATVIEEFDRA
jgi:DNA polymerase-3 subunit gamma/tau